MTTTRLTAAFSASAILIYIGVIALHAGLLPGAEWQGDEYAVLVWLHAGPVAWVRDVLSWSPRPIGIGLLFGYGRLVEATGRQMPWLPLCLAWGLLLAGGGLGAWRIGRAMGPGTARIAGWAIGVAVLTLFLLGHPVAEAFYWPISALAYLPALGAITFVALSLLSGETLRGRRLAFLAALCLAAGSAEVGGMFVCCLAAPPLLHSLTTGRRNAAWFWGPPFLAGLTVLLVVSLVRVRSGSEHFTTDPTYFRHTLASLRGGAAQLGRELVGSPLAALSHIALIAGFAAGLRAIRTGPSKLRLAGLATALVGTAYLSIAPALFTFGFACCERQSTFRQCLYVLLCVVAGAALARTGPIRRLDPRAAALAGVAVPLLAVAILLTPAAGDRLADLIADYRALPSFIRERQENWAAGKDPGSAMVFRFRERPKILNAFWAVPERYTGGDTLQWQFKFVSEYFGKTTIDIVPAALNP